MTERRPTRLMWEQTRLPSVARHSGADVLHCPHYTMPLSAGLPTVVTLHDATFFSEPGLHSPAKRVFFRAQTRHALRHAAATIVPSQATRDELVRLVSPRAASACVVHHGVDTAVFRPPEPEAVGRLRGELGLGSGTYLAFLGTIEPRKNVSELIRGWVYAAGDLSARGLEVPALVLAGGPGWDDTVDAEIAAVPAGLRLIRTGYLPIELLAPLLGGAVAVCYPALGEGFGLPVLEAMACGAAVLTTRRLALPEVGGDAVAYTEPDARSIGERIVELVSDQQLRRHLASDGLRRSAEFSWERAAQLHLEVYRGAARSLVAK
jgi:glycosyltransferase involved in cell wall biosynthesis